MFFEGPDTNKMLTMLINVVNYALCLNLSSTIYWRLTSLYEVDQFQIKMPFIYFRNEYTVLGLLEIFFLLLSSQKMTYRLPLLVVEYWKLITTCLCILNLYELKQDLLSWFMIGKVTHLAIKESVNLLTELGIVINLLSDTLVVLVLILFHTLVQVVHGTNSEYRMVLNKHTLEYNFMRQNNLYCIV
eukprot:snap_masked-scaffold_6-processed-gene-6.41-mRNA-1 protein AED:1.00 eAED:1.00 QI:0/-1/0/0/-1/1/1/0/186